MSSLLRRLPKPALVFALALPLLWLRFGHWFYLSIDEGIYLEGAHRVASGEVPYRDFFAITGPGTFWLYGAVFKLFGTSFPAARALLCIELAAICAAICWLISRAASAIFSAACALLFLAMVLTTMYPVYITHRWDSNTLALLALCFVERRPFAAGLLAGLAVWFTPPLLVVAVALAFFTNLRPYLIGAVIPTTWAVGVLISHGALGSLLHALVWDAGNYSQVNRLRWGALAGTFESFRAQASLAAAIVRYVDSSLPVILPPVAIAIALMARKQRLTVVAALAALVACYPRYGAAQLLFVASFFWVLAGTALSSLVPRRRQTWLAVGTVVIAVAAVAAAWPRETLKQIDTPVGRLEVSRRHFITLNDLLSTVRPGEKVFVYPYLPALYFALGVQNPTRYAWLQPGMMTQADAQSAVANLRTKPPDRVIWHDFTEAYILKNWPNSDRSRLRFPEMESYLQSNYHVVIPDGVPTLGYKLMERNP